MHVLDRGMTKRGGETKDVKPFQGQCKNTHCLLKPRVRPGKYLYRQIYSEGQCYLGCVSLIVAHPSPAIKSSLIPVPPSSRRSSQSRHQVVAHPSRAIKSLLIPVPTSNLIPRIGNDTYERVRISTWFALHARLFGAGCTII
jgi:hypothetical protein